MRAAAPFLAFLAPLAFVAGVAALPALPVPLGGSPIDPLTEILPPGALPSLSDPVVMNLFVNGAERTYDILVNGAIYPGVPQTGRLGLTVGGGAELAVPRETLAIDIWTASEAFDPFQNSPVPLDEVVVLSMLVWGTDDLLSGADGGADLLAEIDAVPGLGNGDGHLSLRELHTRALDLQGPGPRGSPTLLHYGFLLLPEVENPYQDDVLTFDLWFEAHETNCARGVGIVCGAAHAAD